MMKTLPVQVVVIELENGRRGVFVGPSLVPEEYDALDCQVESVWFADVQDVPATMSVNEICEYARNQLTVNQVQ